jgi:hypothetical protein
MTTITINMDAKCHECGKGGAAASGLCLKCTSRALAGAAMKSATGRAAQQRFRQMKDDIDRARRAGYGRR